MFSEKTKFNLRFMLRLLEGYRKEDFFDRINMQFPMTENAKGYYVGYDFRMFSGEKISNLLNEVCENRFVVKETVTQEDLLDDVYVIIYNDLEDGGEAIPKVWENMENKHKMYVAPITSILSGIVPKKIISKLDSYVSKNKVNMYYFEETDLRKLDELSEYEKGILTYRFDFEVDFEKLYGEKYSEEYVDEIYQMREMHVVKVNNLPYRMGYSKYVNFINGSRRVVGTPEEYKRKVLILGKSTILGIRLEDVDTVPSQLQKICNSNGCESCYVANFSNGGADITLLYEVLKQSDLQPGDIVVLYYPYHKLLKEYFSKKGAYFSLKELVFDRRNEWKTQNRELFFDVVHYNDLASAEVAKVTFQKIKDDLMRNLSEQRIRKATVQSNDNYIDSILIYKRIAEETGASGRIGSIVMNCNPFTLGHKYLIDTALEQVDYLYLFIVEEDRSEFPFEDRIKLLRKQYEGNEKIKILGSGKYIISKETFPEYFDKANLQEEKINPVMDLSIFGSGVAEALGIKVRFVGTEPNDKVTNQYNVAMKTVLADFGIEVVEIERKEIDGKVVSATTVRKYLKEKNFEALGKIVPEVTLDYLKQKNN